MKTETRRSHILQAIERGHWDLLRDISLLPGGLESARIEAWRYLLHETSGSDANGKFLASRNDSTAGNEATTHPDERQVHLDTERSFVIYPIDSMSERDKRKQRLEETIISVLRRRPSLRYFQGYHDIVSVLLLTFDPLSAGFVEDQAWIQACVEKFSLHRLRDSMGEGLNPLIGSLRILRRLIRLADAEFAALLERTSPLPYFALSNILTLFSHDIPTLALIQPIFDYLLTRPPIALIYLAAAILLSRKADVMKMEHEGDDGMMHAILSQLPDLLVETILPSNVEGFEDGESDSAGSWDPLLSPTTMPQPQTPGTSESSVDIGDDNTVLEESNDNGDDERTIVEDCEGSLIEDTSHKSDIPHHPMTQHAASPSEISKTSSIPSIPLLTLLKAADDLYRRFPPAPLASAIDHEKSSVDGGSPPSLNISEIFGPTSVMFTWAEDSTSMISDEEAERIASEGLTGVVFPSDGQSDAGSGDEWEKIPLVARANINEREQAMRRRRSVRNTVGITVAVLVGVAAVVLYSVDRSTSSNGRKTFRGWQRAITWAGGIVLDVGERIARVF